MPFPEAARCAASASSHKDMNRCMRFLSDRSNEERRFADSRVRHAAGEKHRARRAPRHDPPAHRTRARFSEHRSSLDARRRDVGSPPRPAPGRRRGPGLDRPHEARVVPEDAPASASRGEALKQVQTRPFSGCHHGQKYRQPGARSRFSAKLARRLSDRPPPTPSPLPRSSDFTPRSSSVSRPSRWLSLVRPRPRRDTSRRVPARGSFFRDGSRAKILARRAFVFFPTLFALFRNNQS